MGSVVVSRPRVIKVSFTVRKGGGFMLRCGQSGEMVTSWVSHQTGPAPTRN